MNIPWEALFDFLLKAIEKCKEQDAEEVVRNRLVEPRGRIYLQIRRGLRQTTDLRGAELKQAAQVAFGELKSMSTEEIDDLIAESNEQ